MSQVFRINRPNVVCEAIDGEVVIVSLDSGYYYSLLGTGADLWQGLEKQLSAESLVEWLAGRYSQNSDEIADAVHQFIAQLQQEELIVVDSATTVNPAQQADALTATQTLLGDSVSADTSFVPPAFEKFSDMEDLLLLDPVHEVEEETGWPQAKSA